jgi:hypothetical protein
MSEAYSDEDSSVEAPPPPPLGEPPRTEDDKYQDQLKIFQDMAEFSHKNEDEEDMQADDGSVEIPPPPNYDRMAEPTSNKQKNSMYNL